MHLKKTKTSVRKLFWALFVVGCGFNVHGVEETTGDVKTVVMQDPANAGQAKAMFEGNPRPNPDDVGAALKKAAENGHLDMVKYFTHPENPFPPSSGDVILALKKTLEGAPDDDNYERGYAMQNEVKNYAEIMRHLLNQNLEPIRVMKTLNELIGSSVWYDEDNENFGRFKDKCWTMIHLFDDYVLPDDVVMKCVEKSNETYDLKLLKYALDLFVRKEKGISRKMAQRLVSKDIFDAVMPMLKLRDPGTTKLSKLPSGVFRAMIEYAFSTNAFPHIK